MSRRTVALAIVLPLTLVLTLAGAIGAIAIDRRTTGTLPSGAFIQGVDVGNLRFDASTSISLPAWPGTIFTQPVEMSMSASFGGIPTTLPASATTFSSVPGPQVGFTSRNGAPPEEKSWLDTRASTVAPRPPSMASRTAAGTSTR